MGSYQPPERNPFTRQTAPHGYPAYEACAPRIGAKNDFPQLVDARGRSLEYGRTKLACIWTLSDREAIRKTKLSGTCICLYCRKREHGPVSRLPVVQVPPSRSHLLIFQAIRKR